MGYRFLMRIECPFPEWPTAWIEIPDTFLGEHARRRDEVLDVCREAKLGEVETAFAISMRLLDDWGNIPGVSGKPDQWDFSKLDLRLVGWINQSVIRPYNACFVIPKKKSNQSPDQHPQETGRAVGQETAKTL